MRTGYCAVTADILHLGHIAFLKKCKRLCDHLTVGVMSDEVVEKYKGHKPAVPLWERKEIVASLDMVDTVVVQDTFEFGSLCYDVLFDSIKHNRKYATCLIPYAEGISSTIIKERIIDTHNCKCKVAGRTVRGR